MKHSEELNHIHKLLLVHRMIYFYKEFLDIQTNLENREKQLFKPLLRIFFGTKTQEDLRLILTNLVNKKRRENSSSLLAFLYQQVKELVERQKAMGSKIPNPNVLSFSAIWSIMTNPDVNPGKENQHKSGYDSDEFGLFTKKEIGTNIRSLGGTLPKKRGKTQQYTFDDDTMSHLAKLYGQDTEVNIEIKNKTRSKLKKSAGDGVVYDSYDSYDSGKGGEGKT